MTNRDSVEIHVREKVLRVPAAYIDGRTIIVTGRWLRFATLRDEELVEGEPIPNPPEFVPKLKASGVRADILTFPERLNQPTPRFPYYFEWDNAAAVSTASVPDWWKKIKPDARQNARKASKRGVVVCVTPFDERLVSGIKSIYDETPIRQGRRFWHYKKSLETIAAENGTYPERSTFIGAYYNDELIGFLKFTCADGIARVMQILSKTSHYDKKPQNALIAKAVEVCNEMGISTFVYSRLTFGNKATSQLAEFKRRNGFEAITFPRYYVPLTLRGRIALTLRLHRGLIGILPPSALALLLRLRAVLVHLSPAVLLSRGTRPSKEHAGAVRAGDAR